MKYHFSNDIEFVGLNAESWKKMIEMEALYPHLCKNISYLDNQTEKHQEINHEVECYRCSYCKDAVNRKNDLAGHPRNYHEDHVEIEQLNIEALSNIYAKVSTNKLVCKRKDECGTEVNAEKRDSESRVKVNIEVNTSFRKRKSSHSDSKECISNLK